MRSTDSARKASTRDLGRSVGFEIVEHRARATFQKGEARMVASHHDRHRAMVRRSTPRCFWRVACSRRLGPWRSAVTKTTTTPR